MDKKIKKEITIEATLENLPQTAEFVEDNLKTLQLSMETMMQINVAVEELFVNIASYAYNPETGPATVRVEVEEDPSAVVITFIDHGSPYDPLQKEDPDVDHTGKELQVGGLGIFLVKKNMDDIVYEYKAGKNILLIRKNVEQKEIGCT